MITFEEFKKVEMKIGTILEVKDHPDADKLYIVRVNLGNEERELVAGIKPHYSAEELVGKQVVVVSNISPAVIRGIKSDGMVLAASDGASLSVITTLKHIEEGSSVK